ncbi:secretin N-terminal domain-containing protein [uncultured Fretibacterium sp.]|uniref:type II secretion system protein GspD n=1 Tax=uncultured Fretibacterium sp. TaxID=1678694 RepID=UPI00260EB1CB|nr:secretin N-terminal domain-containing protein [uncultured Fretibacterium sp.]
MIAAFCCPAFAAGKQKGRDELANLPVLANVEMYPIGDTEVVVGFKGKGLPEPETVFDVNRVRITFRDVRLDTSDMTDYSVSVPMLSSVSTAQVSRDVVIEMTAESPLQLRSLGGVAPADSYTLRFITSAKVEKMVQEPAATRVVVKKPVPTGPFASTTPITLDLRDTELRDVFRMLGAHMKKNIIIDPSLPPALVTMTLKNVPLSEAFAYLMKTYDVSYHMVGKDTIAVGTVDGLAKISGNEETRTFNVAYADPVALQALLVNLTKMPTDRVVVDPRLRALYVTSNPLKLSEVAALLQKLDRPGRQVMLQARILEFSDGAKLDVETALNAVYNHWWFTYGGASGGKGGFIDDNRLGRNFTEPSDQSLSPGRTGLLTPMHGIWREFDVAFRAVEEKGLGKTLASPSVITLDGEEAEVRLTEDYPYISERDDAGNATWATKTVGPQLKMTPKVGRDGVITVKLEIETGEVLEMIRGSTGEQMPRTSTRSVSNQVRVRDGEPFVVGGLFRDNQTKNRVRIPVLGQLPILGELFTYRYNERRKTQVVMLVVPHILEIPDVAVEQEAVLTKR